jgi:hypothetical protein
MAKANEDAEKSEQIYYWWECKLVQLLKQNENSSKN